MKSWLGCHDIPVFAKVWLSPSLLCRSNIFHKITVKSDWALGHVHLVKWKRRFPVLIPKAQYINIRMILRLFDCFFSSQKEQKYFEQWKSKVAIRQCMSASMLTLRCATLPSPVRCMCWWLSFCHVLHFLFEREANGREPGLIMYCVSMKLHREGCYGLA